MFIKRPTVHHFSVMDQRLCHLRAAPIRGSVPCSRAIPGARPAAPSRRASAAAEVQLEETKRGLTDRGLSREPKRRARPPRPPRSRATPRQSRLPRQPAGKRHRRRRRPLPRAARGPGGRKGRRAPARPRQERSPGRRPAANRWQAGGRPDNVFADL